MAVDVEPLVIGTGPCLHLDPGSGRPVAVSAAPAAPPVAVSLTARLVTEGREVPGVPRGLDYAGTVELTGFEPVPGGSRRRIDGPAEAYVFETVSGDWTVTWEYLFTPGRPGLRIAVEVASARDGGAATLRDLKLDLTVRPSEPAGWLVDAPGNELRPGLELAALRDTVPTATVAGTMGSTGLIATHDPRLPRTVVVWPLCRTEIGDCSVRGGDALHVHLDTGLAGRLEPRESLRYEAVHLDVVEATWEQTRDQIPSWYSRIGLDTPPDRPDWTAAASIYEVQLGFSPFRGGYRYEPYPDVAGLRADLDRIADLGYDVLQIMPRQPYPSYNVHDYADIATTYGDEDELRALVADCHARGIRVILDILMHGVIDQDVMARTAQRVRDSEWMKRLDEDTTNTWGTSESAEDARQIAWARHILDFEPYWMKSPERHPLLDERPEWFMRDSDQEVIGIYTHAFDATNPGWQEYFCAAAEDLVRRLDVDGFRIDAPSYNDLPNWSVATRRRASYSPLGCLQLFEKLRPRLKRLKESVLLYTEPSGVLFRESMDLTYNYEEQGLIPAVLSGSAPHGVRNGTELAAWFRDRNAVLPPGSVIAHHIDSHDTFWWPLPGRKWRREQYGLDATRALLAVFALSGGAYMTFTGGEQGIEPDVRRVHRLRAEFRELKEGLADYEAVTVDHDDVYAVVRRTGELASVVLVNLSDASVTCTVDAGGNEPVIAYDVWNDRSADLARLSFEPYGIAVVTLRPGEQR